SLNTKRSRSVSSEDSPVEADEDQEDRQPSEERPQAAAKVGAKKQKKLEEKQARKAQREAELEEREERRKMQELRDQERQKEDEKERLQEQKRSWIMTVSLSVQKSKVVLLEDLASHFSMRTQDAISRLQDLIADGSLT
ncbi:DDRGK domain-containing protein 1-like, partial [Sinocyclocheilus grahami]|uniref:DDRGK domain-containing protein 1-like n=1 Tax=Sinocyclocheilus grahami TaxID=75366 RepID=UPI0007ACEE63